MIDVPPEGIEGADLQHGLAEGQCCLVGNAEQIDIALLVPQHPEVRIFGHGGRVQRLGLGDLARDALVGGADVEARLCVGRNMVAESTLRRAIALAVLAKAVLALRRGGDEIITGP